MRLSLEPMKLFLVPLLFASLTSAQQGPVDVNATGLISAQDLLAHTDHIIFNITLEQFRFTRKSGLWGALDWSSDGCSHSPDNPFKFPFVPACYRHDFAYRNYKRQKRFTEINRERIDNNFLKDTVSWATRDACRHLAKVYYLSVRRWGARGVTMDNPGVEVKMVDTKAGVPTAGDQTSGKLVSKEDKDMKEAMVNYLQAVDHAQRANQLPGPDLKGKRVEVSIANDKLEVKQYNRNETTDD
ncbi:hypothetical protein XA68_12447 [Ophiocordyceps unilateralis]|uniref:Prokaryotic phospholipase A2 n=1 Tax=Ophiocordyceps unilateralis TaxID=268505 RepID=A0A2A9PDJ4_OPHUN|nr:hypothetical protein XA68_12447 [Ophiocordyceps unilateralis]